MYAGEPFECERFPFDGMKPWPFVRAGGGDDGVGARGGGETLVVEAAALAVMGDGAITFAGGGGALGLAARDGVAAVADAAFRAGAGLRFAVAGLPLALEARFADDFTEGAASRTVAAFLRCISFAGERR